MLRTRACARALPSRYEVVSEDCYWADEKGGVFMLAASDDAASDRGDPAVAVGQALDRIERWQTHLERVALGRWSPDALTWIATSVLRGVLSTLTRNESKPVRCSVSLLLVAGPHAALAHFGRTRVYRLRHGRDELMTLRAAADPVQHRFVRLEAGDRFVMCTESLARVAADGPSIRNLIWGRGTRAASELLIERVDGTSGGKDATVITVDVVGVVPVRTGSLGIAEGA